MAFAIDPTDKIGDEIQHLAARRLQQALTTLDEIAVDHGALSEGVHKIRKRTKEVRALARLVRADLGDDYQVFNRTARDAAQTLGPLRDAHALLGAVDELGEQATLGHDPRFARVRLPFADDAAAAGEGPDLEDRLATARVLLDDAATQIKRWQLDESFGTVGRGLRAAYRRGRKGLALARRQPTDEHVHEWRKAVKHLWYDLRALEDVAPSIVGPLVDVLDELAELLGDDHDLAVIVERLESDPDRYGGSAIVDDIRDVARRRQQQLRTPAFRLGATVYAERSRTFADRIRSYWSTTVEYGREDDVVHADERDGDHTEHDGDHDDPAAAGDGEPGAEHLERERKFLLRERPPLPAHGDHLRQGYLALDGDVAVRVRDIAGERFVLTLKGGAGNTRTEVECDLTADEFEALWRHTVGRRIDKTRFRVAEGPYVVEVDVFHGAHEGLHLAEVEFGSADDLVGFEPPDWFGPEVTDDRRYDNAGLAVTQQIPPAIDQADSTTAD